MRELRYACDPKSCESVFSDFSDSEGEDVVELFDSMAIRAKSEYCSECLRLGCKGKPEDAALFAGRCP